MGSPAKHDSSGLATIERMLEKADYKDALKQARVSYRQQPTPEIKSLLERASLLRAEELAKRGLHVEAKEITHQLLDLGVADPAVIKGLLLLLPSLGLGDKAIVLQGRISPEDRTKLTLKLADRAVVRPESAAAVDSELTSAANRVRQSLEALDAGDEARALALLQDIPRASPLAEWRLFVRGLAADRRGDRETAAANWGRLDPQRAAHSIVLAVEKARAATGGDLSRFETAAFGGSVLPKIKRLKEAIKNEDWKTVWAMAGPLYEMLKRNDAALAQRLTAILIDEIGVAACDTSFERGEAILRRLHSTVDPLPLDPKWSRMWALLWEYATFWPRAIDAWKDYLADLDSLAGLPVEANRVKAIVWRRIAEAYRREIAEIASRGESVINYEREERAPELTYEDHLLAHRAALAGQKVQAIEALETSLKLDPAQKATYETALKLYELWDQPDKAQAIAEQMLARFPGETRAFDLLLSKRLAEGEMQAALSLVEQARRARPLDQGLLLTEWRVRHEAVCRLALMREFEAAREEQARIAALPLGFPPFALLAHEAALEFKADNLLIATDLLSKAQGTEAGAPPALLAAWMAGEKMRLPADWSDWALAEWKKSSKRKNAASAAAIARWLSIPEVSQVLGEEAGEFHELAIEYLGRCTRVKFQTAEDVEAVCRYLSKRRAGAEGLAKLAKRARSLFPRSPHAHLAMAQAEIARGPIECRDWMAVMHLNEAQSLAEGDHRNAELLQEIKSLRIWLDDARHGLVGESYDDDEYDDDDDDDYEGDEFEATDERQEEVLKIMREIALGMSDIPVNKRDPEEFAAKVMERLIERGVVDPSDFPFDLGGKSRLDVDEECDCEACTARRAKQKRRRR